MPSVERSDFTASQSPAVSALGVLCKKHLITLVRAFSASLALSQQPHSGLRSRSNRLGAHCPYSSPGAGRHSCHPSTNPRVSRRRCSFGRAAACSPAARAYCHGRAACDTRRSRADQRPAGEATGLRRPHRAQSRRLLPALTGLPALPRGPDRTVRGRPSRRRRLRAAQGHHPVRTSLLPAEGAWSSGGGATRLTVPPRATRARENGGFVSRRPGYIALSAGTGGGGTAP
jgi:hypothetical protein